jgi:hypothetical protein
MRMLMMNQGGCKDRALVRTHVRRSACVLTSIFCEGCAIPAEIPRRAAWQHAE